MSCECFCCCPTPLSPLDVGLDNYYILVYSTVYFHVDGLVRKLHGSAVNDYGYTPCLHIVVDIAETTMTMWTLAVGLGLEGELPKSNIRNRIAKTKKTKVRKMC